MFNWWKNLGKSAKRRTYVSGYDYAVGALLRQEKTEDQLQRETNSLMGPGDYELGMRAGLAEIKRREASIRLAIEVRNSYPQPLISRQPPPSK